MSTVLVTVRWHMNGYTSRDLPNQHPPYSLPTLSIRYQESKLEKIYNRDLFKSNRIHGVYEIE